MRRRGSARPSPLDHRADAGAAASGRHRDRRVSWRRRSGERPCSATKWMNSPSNRKTTQHVGARTARADALGDRVEHRLQIGRRARDDPQHVGRSRSAAPATRSAPRLRACTSSNSRTFSMAMTAWSAKVFSSSICLSLNGRDLGAPDTNAPIASPLAHQRRGGNGPMAEPVGHGSAEPEIRPRQLAGHEHARVCAVDKGAAGDPVAAIGNAEPVQRDRAVVRLDGEHRRPAAA